MGIVAQVVGWIIGAVLAVAGIAILFQMLKHGASVGAAIGACLSGIFDIGNGIANGAGTVFSKFH